MTDLITDSRDEQTLDDLRRDADQLHIPIFQRSYVWTTGQLKQLNDDIQLVRDGIEESQFIGAVITYELPRQHEVSGRLKSLAIVDGQQRLLTLSIYIMAVAELMAPYEPEEAALTVQDYLLLPPRPGLNINTRIVPAYADRNQFRGLWDRLNSPEVLQDQLLSNPPRPPAASGETFGKLSNQYRAIIREIKKGLPDSKELHLEHLRMLLGYVTRDLTFVHLKLNDASSATKIFERLNFAGVKVGIVDLVRNEVFSRANADPVEAQRLFADVWRPFEELFSGHAESFFFPYALIQDSNTKKSEIFTKLRQSWNEMSPEQVVQNMRVYQEPFMAVHDTLKVSSSLEVSIRLERLKRIRRPSVTYPFLMRILEGLQSGEVAEQQCVSILEGLEVFLVRRAILGYEPTGLHALFKSLWGDLPEVSAKGLAEVVNSKPTIQWPIDTEVEAAVRNRSLAKANICGFLLQEFDRSLPGDVVEDAPSIEHILPQSYDPEGAWASSFSKEEHKKYKDTLANLIPLSTPLNSSLQAGEYSTKRARYLSESKFVTPRFLAQNYLDWTPISIEKRAADMAKWVVEKWPNPTLL